MSARTVTVDDRWAAGVVTWLDEQFVITRDHGYKELADLFRPVAYVEEVACDHGRPAHTADGCSVAGCSCLVPY